MTAASDPDAWRLDAACRGQDPAIFFPDRGEDVLAAKAICAGCTVAADCLAYALDNNITIGIWGGRSERQRRTIRRHRPRTTLDLDRYLFPETPPDDAA